ncbi:hypothetical protein LWI28_007115 [Acer negundo]|uniref:Uncharacterized protein n=1 Tax=Acer negundo TaxID=4023 RepID=A0AAD5IXX7_ACENE|nr:hypothetical protein LWI28_007115 [Acer negundo]
MGKEDAWVDNEAIRNYEKKLEELRVKNINKSTSDLQALPQVFATLLSKLYFLDFDIVVGKEDAWVDDEDLRNYEKKSLHCISEYTVEMKKGLFDLMHYHMRKRQILSFHSSCNMGKDGDVAFFFGLSGTEKITLSTDHHMNLIRDVEHCWSENGLSNIEGGCYTKCIDLS